MKGHKIKLADIHTLIDQITDEFPLKNIFSEKVFQAAINPVSFYNENESFFKQFDIDEPFRDLYCWLLIHELEYAKRAYTLDHNAGLADINQAISELSDRKIPEILVPKNKHKDSKKMIDRVRINLKHQGLALLNLDVYSDAYILMIVPIDRVKFLLSRAEKCKLKIEKM